MVLPVLLVLGSGFLSEVMMKSVIAPVFLRTGFNYDRDAVSDQTGLSCGDESRTKQSFKEECDINTIVRRFGVTGQVPITMAPPLQGDFLDAPDFRQSMDLIVKAREAFMELPATVRSRFHNDAAEFVDFCSDRDNLQEARKLGIAMPEAVPVPPPQPISVRVVQDDSAPLPGNNAP